MKTKAPKPSAPPWAADPGQQPDWAAPWSQPLQAHGPPALARWRAGHSVAESLNACGGPAPVRFVPQHALPPALAYETFIHQHRAVPTRDNWHDFFNGLIWHAFAQAKQAMNARQQAEIARLGARGPRGPLRDALTLLDENGALLAAPDPLWHALSQRRWAELFGPLRPLWAQARLWLLGHAALEKLLQPYKSITAHVLRAPEDLRTPAQADAWLADWLRGDALATKPFAPLPLLGVPGWWPANEAPGFYDDPLVFRPARAAGRLKTPPGGPMSAGPALCA